MTTTDRAVTRRTVKPYATLYAKARPVVVTVGPGDVLTFREHGCRTRFSIPIQTAFHITISRSARLP